MSLEQIFNWFFILNKEHKSLEIEDKDLKDIFQEKFGDRGKRAIEGVREKRVKKYLDFWVVVGDKEHIVINERFCDCEDYLYNVSSTEPESEFCWHSIAVRLAKFLDEFDQIGAWYLDYQELL
ncbi:hypothetical protein C9439_00950 [archaeon SCG-AAA382B04]|nr:hypothetical protein C9439_00950 [archaeon SCG-AAA382B04]